MSRKSVIIIGAGYGGLALGNLLAKAGYKVDIYEKNSAPGGRIQAIKQDGFVFDLGPSWYLMPEVFEQYYSLFGETPQERLDLVRFAPGYKVFFQNKPSIEVYGDVDKDKNLFESLEPGAGKMLKAYVDNSSHAYHIAVEYFLYNNFTRLRDIFRWQVIASSPKMLALVFRSLDRYVSTYFNDLRLKQLLEYHMVFLGSSPFQAPAIYTLMSHLDFKSGIFYPKRGMTALVDDMIWFGEKFGVTYHYDSPVSKIITKGSCATGVEVNGKTIRADIIISNADLQHTETVLLSQEHQTYPKKYWEKRQSGPGCLIISLGIEGKLDVLTHHNLFFVNEWRENFDAIYVEHKLPKDASMYICNPNKTDKSLAPENHENIFVLIPLPSGVSLSSESKNGLVATAISILSEMTGQQDLERRIVSKHVFTPDDMRERFNAWQFNAFGGESHLLSQSVIFRTGNHSKKLKNLYYVGAGTLPGIGLPMCLISAEQTYKKIRGISKSGRLTKDDIQ